LEQPEAPLDAEDGHPATGTYRLACTGLASPLRLQEPRAAQARKVLATGRIPVQDGEGALGTDVIQALRSRLSKTNRLVWQASPPVSPPSSGPSAKAGDGRLDDHHAGDALYEASREAH
jgi:hypothetical protein